MANWKAEMTAIQSDIGRERRDTFTVLPDFQPLQPTDIDQKKVKLEEIITKYKDNVVPQFKKEGCRNLILYLIYYAVLITSAVFSALNIGQEVLDLLGTIGLAGIGTAVDFKGAYKTVKQMISDRPLLNKSVTYFSMKITAADSFEQLDELEDTIEQIIQKSLSDYKEFIKLLKKIRDEIEGD